MSGLKYIKPSIISVKDHPLYNEKWVQDRIAEDPSILGLGDLILRDKERIQPRAGRLDLLLQDPEANRRYEVEVQLGPTDESHIIRTIEYWDIERKRYPQYDHCAVIIAEDITSRFLNVISLFNGFIPLIALQMQAIQIENNISLIFTKVLDDISLGIEGEEEELEVTDRSYWEKRGTKKTVSFVDKLLEIIHEFAPDLELKYNKFYIGLAKDGITNNFVIFRPMKKYIRIEIKLDLSDEIERIIEGADLDMMDYDSRWGRYRIRLTEKEISSDEKASVLANLMKKAYERSSI